MKTHLSSDELNAFHDACHAQPGGARSAAPRYRSGVWQVIELNHRYNCLLWDEEDLARRKQVPDAEIASNKRAIDGYNQNRNDAIERIDESLLGGLAASSLKPGARLNSETAGSMVDRLSILSLKIFHMRLQSLRTDVDRTHVESCASRLARFMEQRRDLSGCLDRLLAETSRGEAWFKVYRQFKMYNDPKLNPAVYGEKG